MLRTAFVLVLGLAGVSALGFTAFEATREHACCAVPCEGMPLIAPPQAQVEPSVQLEAAASATALELASPEVSVPLSASDEQPALAPQTARPAAYVPPRLPPCCSKNPIYADGRAPQAQTKVPPPRTAEEKRIQAKLAALRAAGVTPPDAALLAKSKSASPTAAIAPAQPNTKSPAAAALKQPPVK
jgi:hypothetical protein